MSIEIIFVILVIFFIKFLVYSSPNILKLFINFSNMIVNPKIQLFEPTSNPIFKSINVLFLRSRYRFIHIGSVINIAKTNLFFCYLMRIIIITNMSIEIIFVILVIFFIKFLVYSSPNILKLFINFSNMIVNPKIQLFEPTSNPIFKSINVLFLRSRYRFIHIGSVINIAKTNLFFCYLMRIKLIINMFK